MNKRGTAAAVLAGLHLALVVYGAINRRSSEFSGPAGPPLNWYAAVSGADTSYGFFAPDVGAQIRTTFILTDAAGRSWTDTLDVEGSREAQLRVLCILNVSERPQLGYDVEKTWAATMFGRHPDAVRVVVHVDCCAVPSPSAYQSGQRPDWRPCYEATFVRDPRE